MYMGQSTYTLAYVTYIHRHADVSLCLHPSCLNIASGSSSWTEPGQIKEHTQGHNTGMRQNWDSNPDSVFLTNMLSRLSFLLAERLS